MSEIVIIEDEKLLCQLFGSALKNNKYNVRLSYSGEQGLAEILRDRPDLIILDLNLPGLSGAEVGQELLRAGILPRTPLILSTALGEEARPIADLLKAAALLSKPFHLKTLVEEVDRILERPVPLPIAA